METDSRFACQKDKTKCWKQESKSKPNDRTTWIWKI